MNEREALTMQNNLTHFVASSVPRQTRHTDEAIEYWADVYRDHGLARYGIAFELFIQMPAEILARLEDAEVKRRLRDMIESAEVDCDRQVRTTCTQPGAHTTQPAQVHDGRLMQPMAPRGRYRGKR